LLIRRRQPKQSVATKHTDAIPTTGARRRRRILRRSGRIPAMVCAVSACASVRLGRSLPSFAFDLASPMICRERASRRERDGSVQFQPGAARATVRACRVRKPIHPTLAHSDGNRASSCAHTRLALSAASAGQFGCACEHDSCIFLVLCIRDARVPPAAAGLRLESRHRWHMRALPW
jgi:hypothetical protein